MDGWRTRRQRNLLVAAVFASLLGSSPPIDRISPPVKPEITLVNAGKRLSHKFSTGELTAIATRGDRVLAVLTRQDRDSLARGYLRFRIDSAAEVFVASAPGAKPFWLDEAGFKPAGITLDDGEILWELHEKTYSPGWVEVGVNALDRSASSHYAVFVKGREGRAVGVNMADSDGWDMVAAAAHLPLERESGRGLTALPDRLDKSVLIRKPHDERHATMLARGRVWKTHEVASRAADQIVVSFGNDAPGSLTISWRTSPEVARSSVRIRKRGDANVRVVESLSEQIAIPELLNDPLVLRHTARLEGLEPNTTYEYAIGSSQQSWTPIRTPPRVPSDLCLLYMGDPQCGLEGWGKLLEKAYQRRPDAAALLIAGDLVDRGNERTNWDHFFLRARSVFDRLPVMPAVGNHEYLDRGPWLYRKNFALPENGPPGIDNDLVYRFEIGGAFIAVLDSTAAVTDPLQARKQEEWLDEQLSKTRKRWKLVMFHHPLYASHPSRESPALRAAWTPIFDRHHVDLVLQGHDHAYLRTYPLQGGRRVLTAEGTVYVVSVSGDKYYGQRAAETTEVGFTHVSTYQTIDFKASENRLIYRCFDEDGKERDGFTIEKSIE